MGNMYTIKPTGGKIRPAFQIAKSLGISVKIVERDFLGVCSGVVVNLGNKKGKPFEPVILISEDLSYEEQRLTLVHELAHIFLGHLLDDERFEVSDSQKEFEAEALGFILYNFLYGIEGSRRLEKSATDHSEKKQSITMVAHSGKVAKA